MDGYLGDRDVSADAHVEPEQVMDPKEKYRIRIQTFFKTRSGSSFLYTFYIHQIINNVLFLYGYVRSRCSHI